MGVAGGWNEVCRDYDEWMKCTLQSFPPNPASTCSEVGLPPGATSPLSSPPS